MKHGNRPILLCLDLEAGSEELARHCTAYVKLLRKPLHVLYVLRRSGLEDEESARRRLREFVSGTISDVEVSTMSVRRGDVEEEIVNYIKEKDVDITVLGHRHKARRERIYVGSTVKTVISLAPGPVLIVPIDRG